MSLSEEVSNARKRIFRDGYDISFGELASLYEKNELIIQPEYQRLFRWDQTQKTRFIESLLLTIPIPPIFVFSDEKGRWELVDGLQRVSTVLEFMGILKDADEKTVAQFTCDGTSLVPSLEGVRWPHGDHEQDPDPVKQPDVLPLQLQLAIRRSRIRVEILGQETDALAKYELFQRLNSGGANLSEQELRNCIIVSINQKAFRNIKEMSETPDFLEIARVGTERANRKYHAELVVRYLVLRNFSYKNGLDVHDYLDKGSVEIANNPDFPWDEEKRIFSETIDLLRRSVGNDAFQKNARFSLGMYEFIMLGLSRLIERSSSPPSSDFVRAKIEGAPELDEAKRYSGIGVRGTQRLANFVVPLAESYFAG